jgi:DNA polymerase/3'-5' exonuclease PolX
MAAPPNLPNTTLAEQLAEIARLYEQSNETYRARTYEEAARRISQYPTPITSGAQARREIPRVGESLQRDIDEYLQTGRIARLHNLQQSTVDRSQVLQLFESIHGIGPVTANRLFDQGFRTLEDLWFAEPPVLTPAQRLAVIYKEHLKLRIPRYEMDLIRQRFGEIFSAYNPNLQWVIAGSYRRGEPDSGDIDILIREEPGISLADIVDRLKGAGIISGDLAQGRSKYLGILRLPQYNAHRLDLLIISPQNWPYALMYFTGSQTFNILMRQRAEQLGLRLNEYGLYNSEGVSLPAQTEEDIFRALGVQYLSPEERHRDLTALPFA